MKRPTLFGITQYTDKVDWKGDHSYPVIPDSIMAEAEVLLLCGKVGEDRRPPPEGDFDVEVACRCGERLFKRNSAPAHAVALCESCFAKEMGV